jgi:hypothetical protein
MSNSIIKSIEFKNEWTGANGPVYYHTITFENGDSGQIGAKTKLPEKLQVGKSLDYEITNDDKGNKKVKAIQLPNGVQKGGPRVDPETEAQKQRMIVAQSCLKVSGDFYSERGQADPLLVMNTAEEFYKWVMEISK